MKEIFAQRLKSARIMAGLSMGKLVQKLEGTSITRQALHKYESGLSLPGSTVLLALSRTLNVNVDYFFRTIHVTLEQVEFRKKSKLGAKEEARIKEIVKESVIKYLEIEEILNRPQNFINPMGNAVIKDFKSAEEKAVELRKAWNLGLDPVPNILEMLENRNIKVIEIDTSDKFDGLSAWTGNVPILVLNKNFDNVRKRFTAIHELGHLIFDFEESGKETEKLCHYFASAFLIPDIKIKEDIGEKRKKIILSELTGIKEYWGISIQATMRRLLDLHIITDSHYKTFAIWINKENLRRENGLGEYTGTEKAQRFEKLVAHALAEELISFSKASELLGIPLDELRSNLQMA